MTISKYLGVNEINQAILDLTICWRNRLIHYKAENKIGQNSHEVLLREKESILQKYNGLDIKRAIDSYENNQVPSFKEVASMVKASIDFITEIDNKLICQLDVLSYSDHLIYEYVTSDQVVRLNNIYSKDDATKRRVLRNIFKEYCFNEEEDDTVDAFIEDLVKLDYASAKRKYKEGSFK
ncbi:MAG: hypothetical protein A4E56_02763 [Pelotomaculum sp. PtaU1.Bin065]|nr:MAG: hypothetical protein A4E56_02763 [Pelotomaculum sp. PtaU1.Bin065]